VYALRKLRQFRRKASSLIASTAISIPARAPSSTRNGNLPFPAISPQPSLLAFISRFQTASQPLPTLSYFTIPRSAFSTKSISSFTSAESPRFPHLFQGLRSILLGSQQHPERPLERLDPLRRKSLALQPDGVWAEALRLPLGHTNENGSTSCVIRWTRRRRRSANRQNCAPAKMPRWSHNPAPFT